MKIQDQIHYAHKRVLQLEKIVGVETKIGVPEIPEFFENQ